jgi:acyl-CoA synthetase (AMP-forming)/AMP-acid ligase II
MEMGVETRALALNFFHIGLVSNATPILGAGGTVVIAPAFSVEALLELVQRHRLTQFTIPPVFLNLLDRDPTFLERYDLSSIRSVVFGSAAIDEALLRRSMPRFPGATWVHAWAQTELNSGGCANIGPSFLERFGSIGLPLRCIDELAILDDQDDELAAGEIGEVCVRGPIVMLGYLDDPDATADALRNGWLHTGDLGYKDEDGYVFLKGRRREVIIRGGENVYPIEVETVLCQHPAIAEAAVVGMPDSVMTEVPVAFVVLKPDAHATEDEIVEFTTDRLARFKRPVRVTIADELPRTASGKVHKPSLVDRVRAYAR